MSFWFDGDFFANSFQPMVATSGQRQSLNVISAVNARGEFWAATYDGKLNAESFVAFLGNFS
jgi:hypothetical protein